MRRSDRAVTSHGEILDIIRRCKVIRIAMVENGRPYIVPMNFGFAQEGDALFLYFHSALQGRKISILQQNPYVCFEADCDHALLPAEVACQNGYTYASVIGYGTATFITNPAEKTAGLNAIMQHQTGKANWEYSAQALDGVCVFCIAVESITAKARTVG